MNERQAETMRALAAERAQLAASDLNPSGPARPIDWSMGRATAHARALATALDRAVIALLPVVPPERGWALLAVGGYGRRELSPHSDVDLLLLCQKRDAAVENLANAVFYPLWDTGLEVLPAVRTLSEGRRLATDDLATRTASLHTRLLAGDAELYAVYSRAVLADARRGAARPFLKALLAAVRRRHSSYAEAAHGLEPDVKEGRGGLRDVQAIRWASLVALEAVDLEAVDALGYLDGDEVADLETGTEMLLQVRHRLHYLAGRKVDGLAFNYQPEVAAALGYGQVNGYLPVEHFMREMNARADAIARASDGFWEHVEERLLASPLAPVRQLATTARSAAAGSISPLNRPIPGPAPDGPDAALALFAEAARRGTLVGHALIRDLRATLRGAPPVGPWSTAARESFFAVLRGGEKAPLLLEAMADCGLLSLYLPEWDEVRYLARQDGYHLYTVDRHSAVAVEELNRIAAGQGPDGDLDASLSAEVVDFDLLLMATLLHDLAKGRQGDHAVIGVDLAAAVAERMGLSAQGVVDLAFLVRHHLLLARTASRRDLEDDTMIGGLATLIEEPDRLRMLYLLTVADSLATGPSAWTEWKASLVRDLFFRVLAAFGIGEEGAPALTRPARLAERRAELSAALTGQADPPAVMSFLASMPSTYLLSQPTEAVREQFALLQDLDGAPVRVLAKRATNGLYDEVTLVAPDHPGLLWRVCGVFALHGVNILEARVYSDDHGGALDVFRLADAFEAEIGEEKRTAIVRDLTLALEGRLSLGYRLARKLKHYSPVRNQPERPPRVAVDNGGSTAYTIVEVHAPDRLGLLYRITRALSELDLDIHVAKVTTRGPEAVDVFYVRDQRGAKVDDPEHVREVERAVYYELENAG
ncbi:MAG: [protein-PII] uridylyltransferase [Chloroflexota bacterium]